LLAVIGDKKEQAEKESQRLHLIRNYLYQQLGMNEHYDGSLTDYSSVQKEIGELSQQNKETMQASLDQLN
jgi:hypothetical protein